MQVLRTPEDRFDAIPDYPFAPRYLEVADADGTALRIHYVDEGARNAAPVLSMNGSILARVLKLSRPGSF